MLCTTSQVPTFVVGHYVFHVAENQPSGSHVGSVSAVDRDAPPRDQFVYVIDWPMASSVSGGCFRVGVASGQIVTTKRLDRERQEVYHVMVTARPTTTTTTTSSSNFKTNHQSLV